MELDFDHLDVRALRAEYEKPPSVRKPTWAELERRLRQLPEAPAGSKLALSLDRAVDAFPTLFAIHDGEGKVGLLFTGDDGTLVPEWEHVPMDDVIRVFRRFFEEKSLDPNDGWMQE